MPDLTAAELHTLVNSRYVMPDGSERRALWERVPACRPKGISDDMTMLSIQSQVCNSTSHFGLPVVAASVLIRCAVWDWINSQRAIHVPPGDGARRVFVNWGELPESGVMVTLFDNQPYARFSGPSLLPTLVLVAHTLADALGVPH